MGYVVNICFNVTVTKTLISVCKIQLLYNFAGRTKISTGHSLSMPEDSHGFIVSLQEEAIPELEIDVDELLDMPSDVERGARVKVGRGRVGSERGDRAQT